MLKVIQKEFDLIRERVKPLDKKVLGIFIIIAFLQTISWYYTSRRFFRKNLLYYFQNYSSVDLINFLYWFIGDFVTYFVVPAIIIRFIFKDRLKDYGFQGGDSRTGLKLTAVFLSVMIIILWFVSSVLSFNYTYPQLAPARDSWLVFIIFEAGMLLYMFAWEFVWRGFLLFGLEKKFGYYAVMIQMIPFVILHNGKPELEAFSSIAGGIVLGILALRTRSFLYGFYIHFGIIFSLDFISILRYRSGQFGIGFNSFINILRNIIGA